MKFPNGIKVFGNVDYRGDCPSESLEQITFFGWLRREYPDSYGAIAVHVRNEGARHHAQTVKQKAEGMTKGAADIIIPAAVPFVCELKRRDHTKSAWKDGQITYLQIAATAGAFACVALGHEAAKEAFHTWLNFTK